MNENFEVYTDVEFIYILLRCMHNSVMLREFRFVDALNLLTSILT
jgi:hypothetical protein